MISTRRARTVRRIATYALASFYSVFIMGPVLWAFLSSVFREADLVLLGKYLEWSGRLSLVQWMETLRGEFAASMIHTFNYSIITAIMCTVISALAGYAFVCPRLGARHILFASLFAISTIPGWAVAIPNYIYLRHSVSSIPISHLSI